MKFIKKVDIIIVVPILIFAIIGLLIYNRMHTEKGTKAEIYYESELVKTVELAAEKSYTFRIKENEDVLFEVYEDNSIAFVDSDCPDKICINSGKLKNVGQTAACLPNRIMIKIVSEDADKNEIDKVVG